MRARCGQGDFVSGALTRAVRGGDSSSVAFEGDGAGEETRGGSGTATAGGSQGGREDVAPAIAGGSQDGSGDGGRRRADTEDAWNIGGAGVALRTGRDGLEATGMDGRLGIVAGGGIAPGGLRSCRRLSGGSRSHDTEAYMSWQ